MTIHIALLRAVATGESPQQSLPRVASLIVAECSMKRVLATLSQATPVLHASNTNSGAPYLFFGTTVGLVYAVGTLPLENSFQSRLDSRRKFAKIRPNKARSLSNAEAKKS